MQTTEASTKLDKSKRSRPGPTSSDVTPRSLREKEAAIYCGFSASHLRNTRANDMQRQERNEPIVGPRWVHFGAAVRYFREDLDAWLDAHRGE